MNSGLEIRKPGWTDCYLEVTDIDFKEGFVYGKIFDLKTGELINANYCDVVMGWEPVFTIDDVLSQV